LATTTEHISLKEAVRTAMASVPDEERAQNQLTPAQALAMRDEVARCNSIKKAVSIIQRYIFKVPDGGADKVDTAPTIKDEPLPGTNLTEQQLLELIKPNTARVVGATLVLRMRSLRDKVKKAETTEEKLDALADLTTQTGYLSLLAMAIDNSDERLLRLARGKR
jgi:hypothetical protein